MKNFLGRGTPDPRFFYAIPSKDLYRYASAGYSSIALVSDSESLNGQGEVDRLTIECEKTFVCLLMFIINFLLFTVITG